MLDSALLITALLGHSFECPFARASYVDGDAAGFRLTVSPGVGGVSIDLASARTGVRYRFRTDTGNGYATTTLSPLVEDEAVRVATRVPIYAVSADFRMTGDFPAEDDPAPDYLLAPELGKLLWYEAEKLGGPSLASGDREALPRTFFKFESCRNAS